jgi:putative transposase
LLRSSGGWLALKGFRKAGIRLKGDERILGDSDFVEHVLKTAGESFAKWLYRVKKKCADGKVNNPC